MKTAIVILSVLLAALAVFAAASHFSYSDRLDEAVREASENMEVLTALQSSLQNVSEELTVQKDVFLVELSGFSSNVTALGDRISALQTLVNEKIVPSTVIKEVIVNGKLGEFPDITTLTGWCDDHLVVLGGSVGFDPDCDDYAVRLQQEAYDDGYLLSVQLIWNGELWGQKVSGMTEPHMGCLVIVGNDIYFIEPQPSYFRIVRVCPRD